MVGTPSALLAYLFEQPKDKLFEIKEKRNRRTLTQNAYYYALESQLAAALGISNEELHFNLLRDYAPYKVITVRSDIPLEGFIRYYELYKTGKIDDREYTAYKVYKGSSEMNTAEFKRLLDGLIDECKTQGIPTLTPEELSKLRTYDE